MSVALRKEFSKTPSSKNDNWWNPLVRGVVPFPTVATASVFHSTTVVGFDAGDVGPL